MKSILNTVFICFVILFTKIDVIPQSPWTKDTLNNPVLDKGLPGSVDSEFVMMPNVLFVDSVYHMWYCYGNSQNFHYIGQAFSDDGINWTKDSLNNPVLEKGPQGSWDAYGVSVPHVLIIDSIYHMWYKGMSTPSTAGHGAIGHATKSHPDSAWTKDSLNPVLDVGAYGEWDDVWIANGSIIFDGNIYHMWYHAWDGIVPHVRIGHATSPHPDSTWTKDSLNPVLSFGAAGSWDYPRVDAPRVTFDGDTFHMWYDGGNSMRWRIGCATSSDGSVWVKEDSLNPVLDWGHTNEWDNYGVGFCSVLFDSMDAEFKMWYSGFDGFWSSRIGYASAPDCTITGLCKTENLSAPDNYVLKQNYPNPFNPTTTIEFDLPKTVQVSLKVFNILGEEVITLVSDRLSAGSYSYDWDASNLASGVYLYRLQAGDYVETRKMVLMK
jgi:predicted GH43/DUF377 family glycosyl hydrolase